MENLHGNKERIEENGFTIIEDVFNEEEINNLIAIINSADANKPAFRKTDELFAIRLFLKEVPGAMPYIFTEKLKHTIKGIFGDGYFVVKSIYFDKPALSNCFVAYHEDLTISIDRKHPADGFTNWTAKQGQYAAQPPVEILQDNFTIRIHLDDANEYNGALKVIIGSHTKGIWRKNGFDLHTEKGTICSVKKGGIMIMRPLLMHASGRTVNNKRRRGIHIEFSKAELPVPLGWGEKQLFMKS